MYVLEWRTVSALTRGLFWCLFPELEATREINTKITLEWAQKRFVMRVHTLFNFLHDITNPSMTIKSTSFTHRPRVSLAYFSFCWGRHNRLLMTSLWPDNCDAITWIVIFNSLDIYFIHGDIHGRSCKKFCYLFINYSFLQSWNVLLHITNNLCNQNYLYRKPVKWAFLGHYPLEIYSCRNDCENNHHGFYIGDLSNHV